jgi:DNA-binding NtrC family response regulator
MTSTASLPVKVDDPILVVDDDTLLREALRRALQLIGRTTATAADSGEAIAWLKTARPSLVLLDLSMPVVGGEAVATAVRSSYGERVPIIVMSAGADAAVIADRLGAWEFLRKPFDLAELLDMVQHALRDTTRTARC